MADYVQVTTLDGILVEVTFADAGSPPGLTGGQRLNTTACWFRPAGGQWMRSRHRSAIATSHDISQMNASELGLLDANYKSEITKPHDGEEAKNRASTKRSRPHK